MEKGYWKGERRCGSDSCNSRGLDRRRRDHRGGVDSPKSCNSRGLDRRSRDYGGGSATVSKREISKVDDNTSTESIRIDIDGIVEELTNTIGAKLLDHSPLPASCSIFRVPHQIRRQKIQAYEPDTVSIGPFHRGRGGDQFQLMEKVKRWYLQCLLSNENITLANLITGVMDFNERARDCYAEPLDHFNRKDFVEMMVLDGCFLIELFRKSLSVNQQDENDPVFNVSCMLQYLCHDLLLLENQLPWFVLERLYNLTTVRNTTSEGNASSLTGLVLNFFTQSVADERIFNFKPSLNLPPEPLHILDLIRTVFVYGFEEEDLGSKRKEEDEDQQQSKKREQVFVEEDEDQQQSKKREQVFGEEDEDQQQSKKREQDLGSKRKEEDEDQQQSKERELPQRVPNATTLSEAGIKFQKSKTPDCITNIKFENGVFTIPPLAIDERTGPLFRNLIAFEQCCRSRLHKITSYAVLMDNLIDSSKDIDLLCEMGIVVNWLSPEDAAQFFNELYNDTAVIEYYYEGLCNDVNKYYKTDWNKWMEKLRREHFGTPWAIISLVAAFILLVLTMLQTVYTIHQYYHPPK